MKRALFLAFALLAAPFSAHAASGNIPFSGTISGICIINSKSPGELLVDGTYQNLNSLATPAQAEVITTSDGFKLSMDTPILIRPSTDTSPLSMIGGAFHATGATTVNAFDTDPPQDLNTGLTNLSVFFFSSKNGNNIFTAGTYSVDLVLRCE